MNWENLAKNKCPKCGKDTAIRSPYNYDSETAVLEHPCGFSISRERYSAIVGDRTGQAIRKAQAAEKGEQY